MSKEIDDINKLLDESELNFMKKAVYWQDTAYFWHEQADFWRTHYLDFVEKIDKEKEMAQATNSAKIKYNKAKLTFLKSLVLFKSDR